MEKLQFICPKTGKTVDSGIVSELDTLLRIRADHVRAVCPVCGQMHEWQVADAQLSRAA